MLDNSRSIICGDFCGKYVHMCPSKKLAAKDMEGMDLSKWYSVVNRVALI